MIYKNKVLSLAIAMAVVIPATPVFSESLTLEEVVVTARKRMETIQDIPISVTVFTADQLEKAGITEFKQLGLNNPNVKISEGQSGSGISTTIAIRGNLQNDVTFQLDPAVGTYLDGMIVSRTFAMKSSMLDIESIQTLKGPQGTLFGRNTTGGALVIKTVDPELGMGLSGKINAEYGNYDKTVLTAAVNIPVNDNMALRLMTHTSERDGYVKTTSGRELGNIEADSARIKFYWELTDTTSLLLSAAMVDESGTGALNLVSQPNEFVFHNLSEGPAGVAKSPFGDKNSTESKTYNLRLSHETEWGELRFLSGYRELDVEIDQSLPPSLGYTRQDKPNNTQFSAEFQLNGSFFDEELDITSGLYYFDEETNENQATYLPHDFPLSSSGMKTTITSMSAYIQGSYEVIEQTNLTVGARYTSDDRESTGFLADSVVTNQMSYESDEGKFNYLISVDHRFNEELMAYASTSTGYRSGAATIQSGTNNPTSEWGEVDPEDITNYELGFKSDLLDKKLRVNGAFFYQDYENYQYSGIGFVGGTISRIGFSNDATILGGELELTALLPMDFMLILGYGYTESEIDKKGSVTDGARLANIPLYQYNIGLSKTIESNVGNVELQANYDWQRGFYGQLDADSTVGGPVLNQAPSSIDDRGILNISASLEKDSWAITAFVDNATDEEYFNGVSFAQLFGTTITSFSSVGLPRTYGLRGSYKF